jgi:phospholipid/cholesterol/gamma-HCH transport system ATP-binding protein
MKPDQAISPILECDKSKIAISLRGITNKFGSSIIHENLDLDVLRGETIGFVGGSGAGKSVLLRTIIGLNRPYSGSVEVLGVNVWQNLEKSKKQLASQWGVMFQDGALFSSMSVLENVMIPLREHTDLPHKMRIEIAELKILMAGLPLSSAQKFPSELSGGMRKRAALARALVLDPSILFLDEPTAGLDPITAGRFDELINQLKETLGLTVFLITHDLDTLRDACDRVAALANKKIDAIGPMDYIRANAEGWLKEYFSGPRGRAALG